MPRKGPLRATSTRTRYGSQWFPVGQKGLQDAKKRSLRHRSGARGRRDKTGSARRDLKRALDT